MSSPINPDANPFAGIDAERQEIAALAEAVVALSARVTILEELILALLAKKRNLKK